MDSEKDRRVSSEDAFRGAILFMPSYNIYLQRNKSREQGRIVIPHSLHNFQGRHRDAFDHPVVVYSRPECDPDKVLFCFISSFAGTHIEKQYEKGKAFELERHIPIYPADHPRKEELTVKLADEGRMSKNSYIRFSKTEVLEASYADLSYYQIPYQSGEQEPRRLLHLDAPSMGLFEKVLRRIGVPASGPQYITPPSSVLRSPISKSITLSERRDTYFNKENASQVSLASTRNSGMLLPDTGSTSNGLTSSSTVLPTASSLSTQPWSGSNSFPTSVPERSLSETDWPALGSPSKATPSAAGPSQPKHTASTKSRETITFNWAKKWCSEPRDSSTNAGNNSSLTIDPSSSLQIALTTEKSLPKKRLVAKSKAANPTAGAVLSNSTNSEPSPSSSGQVNTELFSAKAAAASTSTPTPDYPGDPISAPTKTVVNTQLGSTTVLSTETAEASIQTPSAVMSPRTAASEALGKSVPELELSAAAPPTPVNTQASTSQPASGSASPTPNSPRGNGYRTYYRNKHRKNKSNANSNYGFESPTPRNLDGNWRR